MQTVQIQVPPNVQQGQLFLAQLPDGQQMQLHASAPAGQMITVQVPAANAAMNQPLMPAQGVQMMQSAAPGTPMAAAPLNGFPQQAVTLPPQVVQGIPVDLGMFQTSAFKGGIDPVPMIDGQTAAILAATNKCVAGLHSTPLWLLPMPARCCQPSALWVDTRLRRFKGVQRVGFWEAISQGMCEQQNVYDIFDDATGQPLFTAMEQSDCFPRYCCAPNHSYFVKFKPAGPGQPRSFLESLPTVMTMEREGCLSKCGLGCCACSDQCKDGYFLHAGEVQGDPGSVQMASNRVMGFATQPTFGGYFTPTINVMERLTENGSSWGSMAKVGRPASCHRGRPHFAIAPALSEQSPPNHLSPALLAPLACLARTPRPSYRQPPLQVEGPCIFGGCTELCMESEWKVSKLEAEAFDTKLMVGDFAIITKKKPRDCETLMVEALTDSDSYSIEFNPGVQLAPQQKALMLASLMQIDYMFFEQDNGICKREGGKTKCTLFQCYCLGCTIPCNCTAGGKNNEGGGPPAANEMVR